MITQTSIMEDAVSKVSISAESRPRQWLASLKLEVEKRDGRSVLARNERLGPLQVQRPFLQPHGGLHVYILHPPGGIAGGDRIEIDAQSTVGSRVLFTTPSATKFYRVDDPDLVQRQVTRLYCGEDTVLEWLPLDTIVFRGAEPRMTTQVQLAECKSFVGWEVVALGRAASGEQFDRGSIHSLWEIKRNEQLLHREYFCLDEAEADFRKAAWGLNGCSTLGTMFIYGCPEDASFEEKQHALRARLLMLLEHYGEAHQASVEMTQKGELLIVRYLGPSGQTCRRLLNIARHEVLSSQGIAGDDARIWNT